MSRHNVDRRKFLKGVGAGVGVTGLAGCLGGGGGSGGNSGGGGNGSSGNNSGGNGSGGGGGNGGGDPTNIGMVYSLGGLGDNSFNDMAHKGVRQAVEEFAIKYTNAEPEATSAFKTSQRRFATSTDPTYELVCTIGFSQASALKDTSKRFSDQKFMIVDSVVENQNVESYIFKEHQGSFLVGQLAGLLTTRKMDAGVGKTNPDNKIVGFVGGKETPLIKTFQAGYMAGVKHVDSSIEIRSAYSGSWNDPSKGKEIALSMYNEGADIVYHAAGATGIGVFKAAQQAGRYAIGVDSDQSKSAPDYANVILASMVKHVDTAVFKSVKHVVNDAFEGGTVKELGLKTNGVECVYGQELVKDIPSDVKSEISSAKEKIINGEIKVPTKPSEV